VAAIADPQGVVLEKEEVVVDQGDRYGDDDEYEGGRGPTFTPPQAAHQQPWRGRRL
jgi:large subunit ribosomal protein L1